MGIDGLLFCTFGIISSGLLLMWSREFWSKWLIRVVSSGMSGPSGDPSSGKAWRVFSGALRYNLPLPVHHTVCWASWMMTLYGPFHWCWWRLFDFQIITQSPFWYEPLDGHGRLSQALRRTSLLSDVWNALRAISRTCSIILKS